MEKILWLLAGHLLGDFPFQSEWMAANKGSSWEINAYHALVYTATILVVAEIGGIYLPIPALLLFFGSHFMIDPLKARWKVINNIWEDQLMHFAVILLVFLLFV
ncbi:MAG: DUF3307 domain-containing protein [Patescibacteria group bacterium]|jgi:hypothetical protein|nr:DUF3307 domain-containing protein [Patescibacteria group bacterium]